MNGTGDVFGKNGKHRIEGAGGEGAGSPGMNSLAKGETTHESFDGVTCVNKPGAERSTGMRSLGKGGISGRTVMILLGVTRAGTEGKEGISGDTANRLLGMTCTGASSGTLADGSSTCGLRMPSKPSIRFKMD